MGQQVTIQVSEQVIRQATQVAAQTHQSVEDVLAAWLESVTNERPVEELSNDEVLALAELRLTDEPTIHARIIGTNILWSADGAKVVGLTPAGSNGI